MANIMDQKNRHETTTTDKYKVINTGEVIDQLIDLGFSVKSVKTSASKTRNGFQKHLVTLRDETMDISVGDSKLELLLFNSYDGSSSLRLSLGVHRLVCSNGLMVKTLNMGTERIVHRGEVKDKIEAAVTRIRNNYSKLKEQIKLFEATPMLNKQKEILEIVRSELEKRTKGEVGKYGISIPVKREGDRGDSLWKALNVVQEGLIRGGISFEDVKGDRKTTKPLTSPARIFEINQRLWEKFSQLLPEVS